MASTLQSAPPTLEKKLPDYTQTHPEQLLLFYAQPDDAQRFSRSIELYDAIPKYLWGKAQRENDKYLPSLKRTFKHRNVAHTVTIAPARLVDKDGQEIEHLPGQREELVEDALRKLACDGKGVFLDNHAGVVFSLYELEQELTRMGHGYNKNQIKEALSICGGTTMTIESQTDGKKVISHIFEAVGLQTQEDWQGDGPKSKAFVCFNPLVTASIRNKEFRPINYEKCMAYRSALARWFHKRLSHNYIGASLTAPFTILLSTIMTDSCMKQYAKLSDNLREVRKALDEMQKAEVLLRYEVRNITGKPRRKLLDAKLTLYPHPSFVAEMKRFNKMMAGARKPAQVFEQQGSS